MNVSDRPLDVFVVGGGPAGLAVAIAARRQGLSVALTDAGCPPIDKACGEGIMPAGIAALNALGIDVASEQCTPFRGIKFVDRSGAISATFRGVNAYGVRRTVLHRALLAQAKECGVELGWMTPVRGVSRQGVLLDRGEVGARYIVLADGQNSALRKMAGFRAGRTVSERYGFRQHYRIAPWSDYVEVHWSDVGQMYVTPVSKSEVGLAVLSRQKGLRFEQALRDFPQVESRISGHEPSSRLMGAVTRTRHISAVIHGNIALAGDASGSVDAITGDGLSLAFREAIALAKAMRHDDLPAYQREHRNIVRRPLLMGRLLLFMDTRPTLRSIVFRALRASPTLFDLLLRVHVGDAVPNATPELEEYAA